MENDDGANTEMNDYRIEFKRVMTEAISHAVVRLVQDSPNGLTEEEIIDEFMKRPHLKQLLIDFEKSNDALIH